MTRTNEAYAPSVSSLLEMLAYRRPAWSRTERNFIKQFILPVPGMQVDDIGNHYVRIGDAPVLWSCHTDTVHHQGGKQLLVVGDGVVTVGDKGSNCLGADNTAGVWLMLEMIAARRPGLYVFHRAEETGGQGSEHFAQHSAHRLEGIKFAIAFDRRGTKSIITHQWGGRCCSEAFAASLSRALGMGHKADDGGSFTDTANYTHLIGECSNLSAGFINEHRGTEALDLDYIAALRDALLKLDVSTLIAEREPGEIEDDEGGPWWLQDDEQDPRESAYRHTEMLTIVRDHPAEIADWLEACGVDVDEVLNAVWQRGGAVAKRGA